MLRALEIRGSGYIGVHCKASDRVCVVPPVLPEAHMRMIVETLDTELVITTIGGTIINGVLCAVNSFGAVVANFISKEEVKNFRSLNVVILPDKHNTAGNNILMNDKAAYVNPDLGKKAIRAIEKSLGIEVVSGTIASLKNVGAAAVVTNKGILCHPHLRECEKKKLKDLFNLEVYIGTANYGASLIGACITANTKGAIVGNMTTGIEMHRIEEALALI